MAPNCEVEIPPPESLNCIFCKATVHFPGLPATKYEKHLFGEHNVMYEMKRVIDWTLQLQAPALAQPQDCIRCLLQDNPKDKTSTELLSLIKMEPKAVAEASLTDHDTAEFVPETSSNFEAWSKGQCLYKCSVCDWTGSESADFLKHIQNIHEMGYKKYLSKYDNPCTLKKMMKCQLCDQKIRHDLTILTDHMKDTHKLQLKTYYEKFVSELFSNIDDQNIQSSEELTFDTSITRRQTRASKKAAKEKATLLDSSMDVDTTLFLSSLKEELHGRVDSTTEPEHDNSTTENESLEDSTIENASLEDSTTENASHSEERADGKASKFVRLPWYCGMLYECKLCQRQYFEIAELKRHLTSKHEACLEDISAEHGDPTVASNFHECLVCGRGMIHCPSAIRGHLNVHDLSLGLYYDQYKDDIDSETVVLPISDKALLSKVSAGRKPAATNQENSPSDSLNDQTLKTNYDWLNQCTYSCKMCDYKTNVYTTFCNHLDKIHKFTGKAYMEKYGGKLGTNIVQHICQLCGFVLDWDRCKIRQHFTSKHPAASLEEYVHTYENTYTDTPLLPENEDDQWMNQCIFECKECAKPQNFNTRSKLILHLHTKHTLSVKDYTDKQGSIYSNFVYHKCKICDKSIRWDSDSIIAHLAACHSSTPKDYAKEYAKTLLPKIKQSSRRLSLKGGAPEDKTAPTMQMSEWLNRCTYDCKICSFETNSYPCIFPHINNVHKISSKAYLEENEGKVSKLVVNHTCQLCGFILNWDRSNIVNHLATKHHSVTITEYYQEYKDIYEEFPTFLENESDQWMNQCTFECRECPHKEKFTTRNKLILHLYKEHKMLIKEYTDKWGIGIALVNNMNCRICEKTVRWDSDSIIAHLDKFHQMRPENYVTEILNGDVSSLLSSIKPASSKPTSDDCSSPSQTPVNEWLNRCIYSCNLCSFEANNYSSFFNHVTKVHKISGKAYMDQNGGKLCSTLVRHTCQLCGYVMDWDRTNISKHLLSKHNSVTNNQYVQTFESKYTDFPNLVENESDNWMNQCIFECRQCQKTEEFTTRNKLILHLLKEHQMTIKEYKEKQPNIVSTLQNITCKICERMVRWDSDSITAHLDKCHQMTPDKYVKEILKDDLSILLSTVKPSTSKTPRTHNSPKPESLNINEWLYRCIYACALCNQVRNSYSSFQSHIGKSHKLTGKDYVEQTGAKTCTTQVTHVCQLCGYVMDWDRLMISDHLKSKHNSFLIQDYAQTYADTYTDCPTLVEDEADDWMNQCVFECKECDIPKEYNTRNKLVLHLYTDHKLRIKDYLEKGNNPITTLVNHTCKICDKVFRWDSDSIKAHLDKFHSATPESYLKDFLKNDVNSILKNTAKSVSKPSFDAINQPSPKLLWNDKCSFTCQICYLVVKSKDVLKWHLQTEHKMKEVYYSEHFNAEPLEKVTHACMICAEETLFDSLTMKKHLQTSHNKMTLDLYKIDYFDKYNSNPESADMDQQLGNKYYCKICSTIVQGKVQYKKHILGEHSLIFNEYAEKHGTGIYEEHLHICQVPDRRGNICSKKIVWDDTPMTYHLSSKHSITPEQYHSKHMKNYAENIESITEDEKQSWFEKCTFLCRSCSKIFSSKSSHASHMSEDHKLQQKNSDSLLDVVVNYMLHTCQLCSQNLLWEKDTLKTHLEADHGLSLKEYGETQLEKYKENEECSITICKFDSWMNRCIFQCKLCTNSVLFNKKNDVYNHLRKNHSGYQGYFATFEEETFSKKLEHFCQICTKSVLWDSSILQRHIEVTHKVNPAVYRAKYMSQYTEDQEEIERLRRDESKAARSSRKTANTSADTAHDLSADSTLTTTDDDEDWGTNDAVRTWARGCLYSCEICNTDFAGARAFTSHVESVHHSTVHSYKKKYGSTQTCIIAGFHFCRLCSNNVRHDEADLKSHFSKEHKITVAEYYEQYKGKLKMPKLVRPATTRANLSNTSSTNSAKRPIEEKVLKINGSESKKRRSSTCIESPSQQMDVDEKDPLAID